MGSVKHDNAVPRSRVVALVIWLAGWSLLVAQTCPPPPPPPINYIYDENGRLLAVIDPNATGNNTGVYSYDAVGNITKIQAYASSQVSIISVSPACGTSGTSVTIRGTGFVNPATSNTVTFNATNATVISGDATTLVVTVPSATSGALIVSNTAGSAQSSFTIPCGQPPTITGFSPTMAQLGTSITVNGTNFQPIAVDDQVTFGNISAMVWSPMPTSLTAIASGTGKISMTTPYGTAQSASTFIALPSPYTAADVASTGTLTPGQTQFVTISAAGKVAVFQFDGTPSPGLAVSQDDIFGHWNICVYAPSGRGLGCSSGTPWVTQAFSETGTYTLIVSPLGGFTGTMEMRVAFLPAGAQQSGARLYLHDYDMSAFVTPPNSSFVVRRMSTKPGAGTNVTWACRSNTTNPASFWTVPNHLTIQWVSAPIAYPARFDCGAAFTFGAWGMESASQAKAAFGGNISFPGLSGWSAYVSAVDDVQMTLGTSGCDSGAGSGAALHTWTATSPTCPIQLMPGDRITMGLTVNAAPGTNGPSLSSGRSVELHYNLNTANSDGASYVDLGASVTFDCTNAAQCGP
jgi:hypothetical protein